MILIPVHAGSLGHVIALFSLLSERGPHQSISHKSMPTYEQHCEFVKSDPYKAWYLISEAGVYVGACYLTERNEVGIAIFKKYQGIGYGRLAMRMMMALHEEDQYYANINPDNQQSRHFFASLGFNLIQVTYAKSS